MIKTWPKRLGHSPLRTRVNTSALSKHAVEEIQLQMDRRTMPYL